MTRPFALPREGDLLADKYRVLRVVADGGMGIVFEAHHELLGKNVALKFPLPELAHLPSIVERFLAEARLCARIENEHVVRVLDVSKLDGLPYIVMELVAGVSLATEMGQPWSPAKAAAFAVQVLEGLEAVHALGVVHRDVKPENILIVATPRGPLLKLIDFGIAKDSIAQEAIGRLTRAGAMLGTPAYMAPEQIRDPLHSGSSVDLYSVGILLFEMLAGASPFTASTLDELIEQALSGHLRSLVELVPSTPPELVAIVARATASTAPNRFQSASDFKRALAPFAEAWSPNAGRTVLRTPSELELQTKTVLRTEYAEPPGAQSAPAAVVPATLAPAPAVAPTLAPAPALAPIPALPRARKANHVRVLASAAVGLTTLLALVAIAFALHKKRQAAENAAPPPIQMAEPETDIAPLDTESPDPSASAGHVAAARRAEARAPGPPKPAPETVSTVQLESRRFRACNSDGQTAEVVVELHIAADGSVRNANAVSSSASAPVTECVLDECRALQFPPHDGADQVARAAIQLPAASDPFSEHRHRPDWMPGRHRREIE